MPLVSTIAGAYTNTWTPNAAGGASGAGASATTMGASEDGFELSWVVHAERVNQTDTYGATLIDSVYRGADWRLRAKFKAYSSVNMNAAWPFGKSAEAGVDAVIAPHMGVISRLYSGVEGIVVLTATASTPAAAEPATLTASHCLLSDNVNTNLIFSSRVRDVPVEWVLFPYVTGASTVWFSTT